MAPQRTAARVAVVWVAVAALGLSACAGEVSEVDRAQTKVTAKEKALSEAEAAAAAASSAFCDASKEYLTALDRYGDVLVSTAPTVGDVRTAGADLSDPRDEAFADAEAAIDAQQAVVDAQQELADAQAQLAAAQAASSGAPAEAPSEAATPAPSSTPAVAATTVDRVKQADADFTEAQASITAETPLVEASERFNSAVVALEMAWLALFADAGCLTDEQQVEAQAAVNAYVFALQQDLATAGYYTGTVDGIVGPMTVQAVEDLQAANGLPVTGTVDRATAAALEAELSALGVVAAGGSIATTAAVQQTLKLAGYWDGPIDGVWTDELTAAVQALQTDLGVEPTGAVDAATIAAFNQAIAAHQAADDAADTPVEPTPTSTPAS